MIEARQVYKRYGQVEALRGLDFLARDGEITGLLGPNGAGKTTALRSLCGLVKPDSGSLRIDEADPSRNPLAARQCLGVVPDRVGHYERLTTREHLHYFGSLQGMSQSERDARIETLVESLGLADIIDRRSKGFSQGQRVKLSLAEAILHEPRNLILDEPSTGLDVMSTRALRGVLRELRGQGRCIVFSSHVMQEVTALCDRIVVMVQGKAVAAGSPEEICQQTGEAVLEDAFVKLTGEEGIAA